MSFSGSSRSQRARQARQAAARPALLLGHVGGHVLGPEAAREHVRHVGRLPAPLVEPDRELEVLGERVLGKPPTLSNASRRNSTLVPQQKTASRPSLPLAIAPKKSACWAQDAAATRLLIGVGVVLRRLHERDLGVVHVPEGGLEEGRVGHVVGVEDRDERRVGQREGVVDVARLRAGVLLAADVAHAVAGGQVAHGVVVAVVEHPDPHLGAAQPGGGRHRQVDDVRRLLVDRHEHVDRHPLARRLRLAHALVAQVHQKPSAWIMLKSSAAIRMP